MTNLSTLQAIVPKRRKRVGRGEGSHRGKNAGLGHKGQNKHGGGVRIGFEGNQNPLIKRTPKMKGFKRWQGNLRNKEEITLGRISQLFNDGDVVSVASIIQKCDFDVRTKTIRVIASGELTKKVTFTEEDGLYLTKGVKSIVKI